MDWARMTLAAGATWAAAIGTAPSRITPIAPSDAMVPKVAAVSDRRTAAGRSRPRQRPPVRRRLVLMPRLLARARRRPRLGRWHAGEGEIAATASRAIGIMLPGSAPRPPRNPRSSVSTQASRHSTAKAATAGPARRRAAMNATRPPRARSPRSGSPRTRGRGRPRRSRTAAPTGPAAAVSRPASGPGRPGCRAAGRGALPEPAPRPGLQDRHADQEHAQPAQQDPAQPRRPPGPAGSTSSAPATA